MAPSTDAACRIALIGDFRETVRAHRAIPRALELASASHPRRVEPVWVQTNTLQGNIPQLLNDFDGIWSVPGSPYENMSGVLDAIRFARENARPLLGTCGGFQHVLLEYTRNVLGLTAADHAESNPAAELPLLSPLSCSLAGHTGGVHFLPGSRLAQLYGSAHSRESYNCNYGLTPRFYHLFENTSLHMTAFDDDQQLRGVELDGHPFFIATLFQPELAAFENRLHPVIAGFVHAAIT